MKRIFAWLAKSSTNSDMLSSSVVASLLFHHINVGGKTLHSTIIPNRHGIQSRPLFLEGLMQSTGRAIATKHAERAFPSCAETAARWWRFSNSLWRYVSEWQFLAKNATLIARLKDLFGKQKKVKQQWLLSDKHKQVGKWKQRENNIQRLQNMSLEIEATF